MAKRNRPLNRWAIGLLHLRPGDRVLDIGCGPGVGLAEATSQLRSGRVAGIDRSGVMVSQAIRCNRKAVDAGLVQVLVGPAEAIPYEAGAFTAAYAVNSAASWSPTEAGARETHRVLAPGGRVAIVITEGKEDAGRFSRSRYATSPRKIHKIAETVRFVGFRDVETHRGLVSGQEHVAILARR